MCKVFFFMHRTKDEFFNQPVWDKNESMLLSPEVLGEELRKDFSGTMSGGTPADLSQNPRTDKA